MAGGRPTKLNKEVCKTIADGITLGMPYEHAAVSAGVSYDTFNNWMKKGKVQKSGKYFEFFKTIKEAEAKGIKNNLALITKSSKEGSWQASAWILERRHPEEFGRREVIKASVEHDGKIQLNVKRAKCGSDSE